jgi:hypothetical protein
MQNGGGYGAFAKTYNRTQFPEVKHCALRRNISLLSYII